LEGFLIKGGQILDCRHNPFSPEKKPKQEKKPKKREEKGKKIKQPIDDLVSVCLDISIF